MSTDTRPVPTVDPATVWPYLDMYVRMDDGTEYVTHADQRDMRRALVAIRPLDTDSDPIGFNWATAWAYLTRTGVLEAGWATFAETVAFVIPAPEQTVADPTGTARAE